MKKLGFPENTCSPMDARIVGARCKLSCFKKLLHVHGMSPTLQIKIHFLGGNLHITFLIGVNLIMKSLILVVSKNIVNGGIHPPQKCPQRKSIGNPPPPLEKLG